jgi:aspartyl aminopeptidase
MPKAITLILPDHSTKKITWKHQYGCLQTFKAFLANLTSANESEIHVMGKTETTFLMLTDQNIFNKWLSENFEQFSVTIKLIKFGLKLNKPLALGQAKGQSKPMKFKHMTFAEKKTAYSEYKKLKVGNFLEFSSKNFSPYHVIFKLEGYLLATGFTRLDEKKPWDLKAGGKYYIKRGFYSAVVAFIIPPNADINEVYFKLLGTHADSPCLRLANKNKFKTEGYWQLAVQTYGGALWKTWFDRELAIGGRVTIRDQEDDTKIQVKLYTSQEPLAFVPSLCPHLQKVVEENELNAELHLRPIIGSLLEELESVSTSSRKANIADDNYKFLLNDISNQLQIPVESIVDVDLCLADWADARAFGPADDFIAASKMDNTLSAWAALDAITRLADETEGLKDSGIPFIMCFDHEEIGSASFTGADSDFVESTLSRIVSNLSKNTGSQTELFRTALARSYLVSADVGHSFHPNYPQYFKDNYKPTVNKGILIKTNDSQRYTTTSVTRPILRNLAEKYEIPIQDFIVRNDKPCGSTIGPFMSKRLGVASIDVGAPILAMHSIREFSGTEDLVSYADLFFHFLLNPLPTINDTFQ